MNTSLDLRQLAVDRTPAPGTRRSPVFSRYVLPGSVVAGLMIMLAWAARDRFATSKVVTVVPVVVSRAEVRQAGTPLFQAPGWIEPMPTPVLASALAEGIVEELLVVEGQSVASHQPVARLISADAQLLLRQSQASLDLAKADVANARAELQAARTRRENPVHLQAVLSEAESALAKTETELSRLPYLIEAAAARSQFANQNLAGKRDVASAISGRSIQQAESESSTAAAELKELEIRKPRLEQERDALRKRKEALSRQMDLLIDETRQVATTEAQLNVSLARQLQAELGVETSQLRLDRTVVRSPIAGRVLSVIARPGSRVMGLEPGGEQKASTIVSLYDPDSLQVRADVRLEDVPLIQPGQPVHIETPSHKGVLQGRVRNVTSQANIQKNTLEVKIEIISPPANIRPEMLVATTFLAIEQPGDQAHPSEQQERLLVPRQLVETEGGNSFLWVADAQGTARRQTVALGQASTDLLVEIASGIQPTDRLVSGGREGLKDGDRLVVRGEDETLGLPQRPAGR